MANRVRNLTVSREGDELVIRCNLRADAGRSRRGNSEMVATTGGNLPVGDDMPGVMVQCNVFWQPESQDRAAPWLQGRPAQGTGAERH